MAVSAFYYPVMRSHGVAVRRPHRVAAKMVNPATIPQPANALVILIAVNEWIPIALAKVNAARLLVILAHVDGARLGEGSRLLAFGFWLLASSLLAACSLLG